MRAKDRGTSFETAVVNYLREHGFPHVERRALHGNKDKGDIAGLPGWVIECKNHAQLAFGVWLREAAVEAANAGADFFALIAKRRRSPGSSGAVADSYVVMPLRVFAAFLSEGDK